MNEKDIQEVSGGTANNDLPGHLCGDGRTGYLRYVKFSTYCGRDIYRCRTCGAEGWIMKAYDPNWCDLVPEH